MCVCAISMVFVPFQKCTVISDYVQKPLVLLIVSFAMRVGCVMEMYVFFVFLLKSWLLRNLKKT